MNLDKIYGREIARKYLCAKPLERKLLHSYCAGQFAYKVALKILKTNSLPEYLDADLTGFLGCVHDIGVARSQSKHELHTIDMLVEEGIGRDIARRTMHGQMEEQYGDGDGRYLPVGIEGMILTYADMTILTGNPISMEQRCEEIKQRVSGAKKITPEQKEEIIVNLDKAMPRYKFYERIILRLADANSFRDF
ncbi:MAG: hypothetical protein V1734_00550 [Nanoarchaeota archaeon]